MALVTLLCAEQVPIWNFAGSMLPFTLDVAESEPLKGTDAARFAALTLDEQAMACAATGTVASRDELVAMPLAAIEPLSSTDARREPDELPLAEHDADIGTVARIEPLSVLVAPTVPFKGTVASRLACVVELLGIVPTR